MEEGKGKDEKINKYSCACAIVASMISIIFGYETGVMSGAMIFIKEDLNINDVQIQVLAGIINFFALVGALSAGRTSDYIGRRYTICLASFIFLLGSLLMGFAPNYAMLFTGRCVAGVGVGFALVIAPVYSAEISATNSRGFLASLPELGISLGILTAPKFEDLAPVSSDTPDKLALLFQIPNRERACQFELTPSEASFSSEHTPSMSSVPQFSTKFSLVDLKSKMVKKEKVEGTPSSKPIHTPATRSSKRKKGPDNVINLELFEGLSAPKTKDRVLMGVDHLFQLLNNELLDSKEKYLELKKTAAEEVEALRKEAAEEAKKVKEEKRLMAEEAQSSAAASVIEAMYEMAKEASAAGFSLPSWDVKGWSEMLGRTEDEGLAAKEAEEKPGAGGSGGGDGASMGDEGVMTA